jgi:uncharacterized membrane protein YkoI
MRRRHLFALFLVLAATPVLAQGRGRDDDDDDHDDALRGVEDRRALALEELLRRFAEQISGRVVDVSLEERGDRLTFRVTYVAPDGHVRRARLDAATGAVLD